MKMLVNSEQTKQTGNMEEAGRKDEGQGLIDGSGTKEK